MNPDKRAVSAPAVAIAGMLSLAVGVGIGRFAFTPVLPLMLQEGRLDVALAAWLAAANYAGYLAGALAAPRIRCGAPLLGLASLLGVAACTAAMALPGVALWLVLRFAAGVLSAWVFVATAVWCLGTLARLGRPEIGGWAYTGVGVGILLAGLYCLGAGVLNFSSGQAWVHLALLSLVLIAWVFVALRPVESLPLAAPPAPGAARDLPKGTAGLVVCYGLMGLGYILPATFLPVMARAVVSDPVVFGAVWPVYGATAAGSTLLLAAWTRRASLLHAWALCQAVMGVGVLLPTLVRNGFTIFVAAVAVGGTFMVITLAGLQEIRRRVSWNAGAWVGYMTAAFATGQIAGPAASGLMLAYPPLAERGLDIALQVSAFALLASAAWLWRQKP